MRIRGRRPILYALLALAVPLPAFALTGGDASGQSLSVSASLGGCGLAQTAIMCEIDASWNSIDDADYYTATVTAPNGSVTDFGSVGSGSASVYVPYAGDGNYSVQVTAWGEPDDPSEKPELIESDVSSQPAEPGAEEDPGNLDPGRDSATPEDGSGTPASPVGDDPGDGATQPVGPTGATGPSDPTVPTTPVDPTTPTECTPTPPTVTTPEPPTDQSVSTDSDTAAQSTTTPEPEPEPDPVDPACP